MRSGPENARPAPDGRRGSPTGRLQRHAVLGVAIGFALSASFFVFFGAFQLVGFFLWSVLGGGGGGVLGGYAVARFRGGVADTQDSVNARFELIGATVGAIVLRLAIFVLFGSY